MSVPSSYFIPSRLTPELSRPVAGWQTRASVAQKHAADATTRGRLERIVRREPVAHNYLQNLLSVVDLDSTFATGDRF